MDNALLNKAATLAAKKYVLLADPKLPPAIVNAQTKPLSQELTKLTKCIPQFPGGAGPGAPDGPPGGEEEEEGDLVTGPMVQWLKHMLKPVHPPPNLKSLLQDSSRKAKQRPPVKFLSRKGLLPTVKEIVILALI